MPGRGQRGRGGAARGAAIRTSARHSRSQTCALASAFPGHATTGGRAGAREGRASRDPSPRPLVRDVVARLASSGIRAVRHGPPATQGRHRGPEASPPGGREAGVPRRCHVARGPRHGDTAVDDAVRPAVEVGRPEVGPEGPRRGGVGTEEVQPVEHPAAADGPIDASDPGLEGPHKAVPPIRREGARVAAPSSAGDAFLSARGRKGAHRSRTVSHAPGAHHS